MSYLPLPPRLPGFRAMQQKSPSRWYILRALLTWMFR